MSSSSGSRGTKPEFLNYFAPWNRTGLGPQWQLLVFFVSAALIVSRRPDALFNPQFFAEDGSVWFREAFMFGWFTSLLHSRNGYFQTIPRLVSAVALLVPFRFAPLVMNLTGITIQVLPVNFLLSARCRNWAPLFPRALMALLYLALPNSSELDAAINEGQWHLGLLACLVILASPPTTWLWRTFDLAAILLSGLSGPFGVVLLPIAGIFWWFRRERWRLIVIASVTASTIVQLLALLTTAMATRPHVILGATFKLFLQLLAGQVYLGAMLGESGLQVQRPLQVLAVAAVLGTAVIVYCFFKAPLEWKLFLAFCILVFAASLKSATVSTTTPQWLVLRDASGIRYWFFPMLAFLWALVWCATLSLNGASRFVGVTGLLMTCFGIKTDWRYPPYTDFHFARYAERLAPAPPGVLVTVPILPDGWTMRLVKKSPGCRILPIGAVDQPKDGARIAGSTVAAGWVMASQPIRQVKIYLDRALLQSVTPSFARPDVDVIYPQSPDKEKGWSTTVDISKAAAGEHELEVRAAGEDGCEADIAIIPIERVK